MIPFPVFRQFEVLRLVGSGGMASVYEAMDKRLSRRVALKVIHPHLYKDENAVERFKREALAAAKMDHPNIVRIYDFLDEAGLHAMVMEFVPGTDCGTLVKKKGALPFDLVCFIMHETALALQEAHLHEFLHRDVKPSNILLHRKNRVLLSDFGLARRSMDTHLTMSQAVAGTPGFMSPEHVTGKNVSFASDVYAWGVSFYYLLMGRLPYDTTELAPLLNAIQEGRVCLDEAVLEKVPGRHYAVLQQCLMRDQEKRLQNGRDLVIKLEEAGGVSRVNLSPWIESVAEEPEAVPKAKPQPTLIYRPWKRRLLRIGAPALAALVLIAGFFMFREPKTGPLPLAAGPRDTLSVKSVPAHADTLQAPPERPVPRVLPRVVTAKRPREEAPDSGGLFIFCSPWANIEIDGKAAGKTPLETPISLPRGKHLIKLYNEFCEPLEEEVDISGSTVLRRRYELKIKPAYQQ